MSKVEKLVKLIGGKKVVDVSVKRDYLSHVETGRLLDVTILIEGDRIVFANLNKTLKLKEELIQEVADDGYVTVAGIDDGIHTTFSFVVHQ